MDIIDVQSEAEGDVLNVFKKLGCSIPPNRTEACHRVSKNSATVIIRFSRRKDCQQVLPVKKDLHKTKMEDVDQPGQNKLFLYKNLRQYYKVLWFKTKMIHSLVKINSFFTLADTIKINVSENSLPLSITPVDDFGKYFRDIDLSPPCCSV